MTMKELFDFVTDPTIDDDNITAYLDRAMEMASQRTVEDITEQQKVEEQVRGVQGSIQILCILISSRKLYISMGIYGIAVPFCDSSES